MNEGGLKTRPLQRANNPDEYKLYRAALEWDLIDPIVLEDRKDFKSEFRWHDLVDPYDHQVKNLITFCGRLPVTLLADDVGLGKTISAGLVVSELMSRGRINKILIVCPKLLIEQWQEELKTKFKIPSVIAVGKELLDAETPEEGGAVITTYHSARLYLDKLGQAGFQMLILDEAHKLRNLYGVAKPPQVAKRFRQALADRLFKYVLMLTATPVQNRLWDLYSLIELLTVARGHENPFGSPGLFKRRFISERGTKVSHLKPEMAKEFQNIVYGYISRVRRDDAKLHFPERVVELHQVDPTKGELKLIELIAQPIQKLGVLSQISILQALISSPEALSAQLNTMARNGTVEPSLATDVRTVVSQITTTAKLEGLGALIKQLRSEKPDHWRVVIFTTRRETQISIQLFLEAQGITCGLINGDSGERNQEAIRKLKKNPPDVHVVISTEAGSEGVNLQAANVLVNYDLPWNPMVVEQRIGRIQRLASEHKSVCIFNIVLRGTFEEYIVGRLIEKMQMASTAIGDVESLLEAAGMNDLEDTRVGSFEDQIRKLVVASLAGKDVEAAARKAAESIAKAKVKLKEEEKNINTLLGSMGDATTIGPRSPKLPNQNRSMSLQNFVLAALENLGAHIIQDPSGVYISELGDQRQAIRFDIKDADLGLDSKLYASGMPAFESLVSKMASKSWHLVEDTDQNSSIKIEEIADKWVLGFNAVKTMVRIQDVYRCFTGVALTRVRATVAHDSYERLVEINCSPNDHRRSSGQPGLEVVSNIIENPASIGITDAQLVDKALLDEGINEFCRFYNERLTQELPATGDDLRKRKKIVDDLTPRLEIALVGLEGVVHREVAIEVFYKLGGSITEYQSLLTIVPSSGSIIASPEMGTCSSTAIRAPRECLSQCEISGRAVLKHLLVKSEISDRVALPENTVICAVTSKRVLSDEVEKSAITGHSVISTLLKTSTLSGKRAEPEFFGQCEFTSSEVLTNELAISQISNKRYRIDQELRSVVSGKVGHRQEFIFCEETKEPLLLLEAEKCAITGKVVKPGILIQCAVSGKKVMPAELEKSDVTGKLAIKSLLKISALSGKRAEPQLFGKCEFSGSEVLRDELAISKVSGKLYRVDEEARSEVSDKTGHRQEFIICAETNKVLLFAEAEKCEVTGKIVMPGILETCAVSGKKVLTSQLEKSALSGKKALNKFFVSSNISGALLLEDEAVCSIAGKFCSPLEVKSCVWSGRKSHPDDMRTCQLTGLLIHVEYITTNGYTRLEPLINLLNNLTRKTDKSDLWPAVETSAIKILDKKNCKVNAALLSPDSKHLAIFLEIKQLLGFKVRTAGLVYSIEDSLIVGRISIGRFVNAKDGSPGAWLLDDDFLK